MIDIHNNGIIRQDSTSTITISIGNAEQEMTLARNAYDNFYAKIAAPSFDHFWSCWQTCLKVHVTQSR